MTSKIIYHDFRMKNDTATKNTAARVVKASAHVNAALNTACIFLCGACTAISILALVALSMH